MLKFQNKVLLTMTLTALMNVTNPKKPKNLRCCWPIMVLIAVMAPIILIILGVAGHVHHLRGRLPGANAPHTTSLLLFYLPHSRTQHPSTATTIATHTSTRMVQALCNHAGIAPSDHTLRAAPRRRQEQHREQRESRRGQEQHSAAGR